MDAPDLSALLGPDLSSAIASKGYTSLTQVQEAVLAPALADRDLRISSQTGSGKTLAIGFAVRQVVKPTEKSKDGIARPCAVVITPTRELAKQVEAELSWLYAPSKVSVASVTGGSSMRDDYRLLARCPGILVGTPGRLLDHLRRHAVELTQTGAIVLDEADRMLDLGFREDLEAILAMAPENRRTHLVSATFPREVEALAKRVQKNPSAVQGTPLGSANADIEHLVHLVKPNERVAALINLLLLAPDEQVLAFARTRADVAQACEELHEAGFAVDSLSGEMEQDARQRALTAFKQGKLQVLVATDVAARGIDHRDIARVVQLEPPNDPDTYTHRSGRTGRAGRKGKSSIMVQPAGLARLSALLGRARVRFSIEPIPTAEQIVRAQDDRLLQELCGTPASSESNETETPTVDARALRIAAEIVAAGNAEQALARLIAKTRGAADCSPRDVTPLDQNGPRNNKGKPKPFARDARPSGPEQGPRGKDAWKSGPRDAQRQGESDNTPRGLRKDEAPRGFRKDEAPRGFRQEEAPRGFRQEEAPRGFRSNDAPRGLRPNDAPRGFRPSASRPNHERPLRPSALRTNDAGGGGGEWVRFRVSWGEAQGADARRLLPMLCRRGKIRGTDIGAIQLAPSFSLVDVALNVAGDFERATRLPDPRDPAVTVRRDGGDFAPSDRHDRS